MAYEIPGLSFPLPSAADYRTANGQYRFCKVTTTGKAQQTVLGEAPIGVRQNTPNTNEAMTIVTSGISMVECGSGVTAGDQVGSDATGRAKTAASGEFIAGRALETGSGAGIVIAVLLDTPATAKA